MHVYTRQADTFPYPNTLLAQQLTSADRLSSKEFRIAEPATELDKHQKCSGMFYDTANYH